MAGRDRRAQGRLGVALATVLPGDQVCERRQRAVIARRDRVTVRGLRFAFSPAPVAQQVTEQDPSIGDALRDGLAVRRPRPRLPGRAAWRAARRASASGQLLPRAIASRHACSSSSLSVTTAGVARRAAPVITRRGEAVPLRPRGAQGRHRKTRSEASSRYRSASAPSSASHVDRLDVEAGAAQAARDVRRVQADMVKLQERALTGGGLGDRRVLVGALAIEVERDHDEAEAAGRGHAAHFTHRRGVVPDSRACEQRSHRTRRREGPAP